MEKEIKEKIKNRQKANFELIRKLSELVIAYPDQRFGQILVNLNIIQYQRDPASFDVIGIKDPFYEESVDILNRVNNGRNS
jgi:hypothetical protein